MWKTYFTNRLLFVKYVLHLYHIYKTKVQQNMNSAKLTRKELKKAFRVMLMEQSLLRYKIAGDLMISEVTINRWAKNNNPKLCSDAFLSSLKKHAKITVQMTEDVPVSEPELIVE